MLLFVPITYIKLQQGMFPMKLTALRSAILLSLIPTTSVIAGGLDRSGQSMSAFFQSGNYAEAGFTVIDPTVEGTSTVVKDEKISDMGGDYYFPSAAIKIQPTDNISLGLLYDQPFGADATYSSTAGTFGNGTEGTSVEVDTHNLTALIGYQPTKTGTFMQVPYIKQLKEKFHYVVPHTVVLVY